MTYDGNVRVGGPPAVHELRDLVITKIAVGPMHNNAYLLRCADTGDQVLVDAADEPETLLRTIGGSGRPDDKSLTTVVTTHRHPDHWRALADVSTATGARVAAGVDDADAITEGSGVTVDDRLPDGGTVQVGTCSLAVIQLVGHTPGSIALLYDDPTGHPHLFTGDSLFPGGVGNTHGNPDDFASLLGDVERKLFDRLPDETWVYPGHGGDTTLGAERPSLPEWRARGW